MYVYTSGAAGLGRRVRSEAEAGQHPEQGGEGRGGGADAGQTKLLANNDNDIVIVQ